MTAERQEITVFPDRLSGVWKVCFHGDAEVISACGTDTIESAYFLTTPGPTVLAAIQAANPRHFVRLVDVDGLRL